MWNFRKLNNYEITYKHINSGKDNDSGNEGFFEKIGTKTGKKIDEAFAGGD